MVRSLLISLGLLFLAPFITYAQVVVHDVKYLVLALDNNANLNFTKVLTADQLRERFAGDIRLDPVQVLVIIKCIDQKPVDTTRVRLRIMNDASGRIVYNTSKMITRESLTDTALSSIFLCDENGAPVELTPRTYAVAPGEYVAMRMPPFTSSGFLSDVGRLSADAIAIDGKDTVRHLFYKVGRLTSRDVRGLDGGSLMVMRSSGMTIPSALMFVNGGTTVLNSAIRFDRRNELGAPYQGVVTGDTLTSFPINLIRKKWAVLSISARRAYPRSITHRRWRDDTLHGPEPTSTWEGNTYPGDSLVVDLLKPSPDQLNGIINTVDSNWIEQPSMRVALAMREPNYRDRFDVFTIPIPDAILNSPNEGARNFRFRIILNATALTASDDDDPWDVDRIDLFAVEEQDLSINDVEVPLAYSVIPYRQAAVAPLRIRLVNHTQNVHHRVRLRVEAYSVQDTLKRTIIERLVDSFDALEQRVIDMPHFNLSAVAASDVDTIILKATISKGNDTAYADEVVHNNTIYRRLPVHIGRSLAYDNYEAEGHHVVAQEAGLGRNFGLRTPATKAKDDSVSRYGGTDTPSVVGPGGITMTFPLDQLDTLFGYQIAFDRDEPRNAQCMLTLVRIMQSFYQSLPDGSLWIYPGRDDSGVVTDTIGTYSLSAPVVLEPGTYELTLTQFTHEDLNLCATAGRAGVLVQTATDTDPDLGSEIIADPSWFVDTDLPSFPFRSGNSTTLGRFFVGDRAYRSYTYGDFGGRTNGAFTFRRGTFVPVMRVVLGHRSNSIPTSVEASVDSDTAPLISLYPSPASSVLITAVIGDGDVDIIFFTMQGERIHSQRITSTTDIDVSMLASGRYIILARRGHHSHTQTVSVMR